MRSLCAPERDYRSDYQRASDHRAGAGAAALQRASNAVFNACEEYPTRFVGRKPIALDSEATGTVLKGNYSLTYAGKCLYDLRAEVLSAARGKCPFCEISAATTVDHYLPKTHYPEFSIYPLNLVPLCADCNLKKRDQSPTYYSRYPHVYLDPPINCDYLVAQVDLSAGLPVMYSIDWQADVPVELKIAVERGVEDLDLLARYSEEAADELAGQANSFKDQAIRFGLNALSKHIKLLEHGYSIRFGRNHWRVALFRSLSGDLEFLRSPFWEYLEADSP
jgi:5-methylcytosine-specific restriction endonuclease McrA